MQMKIVNKAKTIVDMNITLRKQIQDFENRLILTWKSITFIIV